MPLLESQIGISVRAVLHERNAKTSPNHAISSLLSTNIRPLSASGLRFLYNFEIQRRTHTEPRIKTQMSNPSCIARTVATFMYTSQLQPIQNPPFRDEPDRPPDDRAFSFGINSMPTKLPSFSQKIPP